MGATTTEVDAQGVNLGQPGVPANIGRNPPGYRRGLNPARKDRIVNDNHELDRLDAEPRQRWPLWATLLLAVAAICGTALAAWLLVWGVRGLLGQVFKPWA